MRRAALVLVAILAAPAASGCLGFPEPCAYDYAILRVPGAYETLGREGAREHAPEEDALPFGAADVHAAWGEVGLEGVSYVLPTEGGRGWIDIHKAAPARVSAVLPADMPEEDARSALSLFLADATAAPPERRAAWVEALVESRSPGGYGEGGANVTVYGYETPVEGPFRLGELWAERGGLGEARLGEPLHVGYVRARVGDWEFRFEVALRQLDLDRAGGSVNLRADAADQVSVAVARDEADLEASAALFREALGSLGLTVEVAPGDIRSPEC